MEHCLRLAGGRSWPVSDVATPVLLKSGGTSGIWKVWGTAPDPHRSLRPFQIGHSWNQKGMLGSCVSYLGANRTGAPAGRQLTRCALHGELSKLRMIVLMPNAKISGVMFRTGCAKR